MANEGRLSLGYPLDLLLNRECTISDYSKLKQNFLDRDYDNSNEIKSKIGGITLAKELDQIEEILGSQSKQLFKESATGTGNIVIQGKPGTGKSTLAMQIAVMATLRFNNYNSVYLSLEEPETNVIEKAKLLNWNKYFRQIKHLHLVEEASSLSEFSGYLKSILTQPKKTKKTEEIERCPFFAPGGTMDACQGRDKHLPIKDITNRVILPSLSPRNLSVLDEATKDSLFWKRYKQIESLFKAYKELRESQSKSEQKIRRIGVVIVDSLNVFGDRPLTRVELFRLFDLFRRYQIIGVFIVEEGTGLEQIPDHNTIEYIADMVISLRNTEDEGYFTRHLEIKKSRYQHQIYGKHPFRIISPEPEKNDFRPAIEVFPSLHYMVHATEPENKKSRQKKRNGQDNLQNKIGSKIFGISGLDNIIPNNDNNEVFMIEGGRSTFKTTIAVNFLIKGLLDGEGGLLISLHDSTRFRIEDCRLSTDLSISELDTDNFKWETFADSKKNPIDLSGDFYWMKNNKKIAGKRWKCRDNNNSLIELAFKSGMVLSEEFIDVIQKVIQYEGQNGNPIKRVVFNDIKLIGVSYPFLKTSYTSADMFLPAFVHLMRNNSIKLVMAGTSEPLNESIDAINRASSLADTVITCKAKDIFGDQYVIVQGEGLRTETGPIGFQDEPVPGIILIEEQKNAKGTYPNLFFKVDQDYLKGLVGFDTPRIYRPGLTLQFYEQQGEPFKEYNEELLALLDSALGTRPVLMESKPTVELKTFDSSKSEAFHESYKVLQGQPLDRTIICTLDDFWKADMDELKRCLVSLEELFKSRKSDYIVPAYSRTKQNENLIFGLPYFCNVLLIAYNNETMNDLRHDFKWSDLTDPKFINTYKKDKSALVVNCDLTVKETMSCLLLDAIISGFEEEIFDGGVQEVRIENNGCCKIIATKRSETKKIRLVIDGIHTQEKPMPTIEPKGTGFEIIGDLVQEKDRIVLQVGYTQRNEVVANYESAKLVIKDNAEKNIYEIELRGCLREPVEVDRYQYDEDGIENIYNYHDISGKEIYNKLKDEKSYNDTVINNLISLCTLLHNKKGNDKKNADSNHKQQEIEKKEVDIHICWYSQLRALIHNDNKLADKLNVVPLPGRGFKGDWYLGIVRGSVSTSLGKTVIEKLCNKSEEYKRFARGIGIPTLNEFYSAKKNKKDYFAWPGASQEMTLNHVINIHRKAICRSYIPGYSKFRSVLYTIFMQILKIDPNDAKIKEKVGIIVNRLPYQIKMFYDDEKGK